MKLLCDVRVAPAFLQCPYRLRGDHQPCPYPEPAEAAKLLRLNLLLPVDIVTGVGDNQGVLTPLDTKTAARAAHLQYVLLDDPFLVHTLIKLWVACNHAQRSVRVDC